MRRIPQRRAQINLGKCMFSSYSYCALAPAHRPRRIPSSAPASRSGVYPSVDAHYTRGFSRRPHCGKIWRKQRTSSPGGSMLIFYKILNSNYTL